MTSQRFRRRDVDLDPRGIHRLRVYLHLSLEPHTKCLPLHGHARRYNTAIGVAILRPTDELVGSSCVAISFALTGTLWLVAVGLIVATRGRLGLEDTPSLDARTGGRARRTDGRLSPPSPPRSRGCAVYTTLRHRAQEPRRTLSAVVWLVLMLAGWVAIFALLVFSEPTLGDLRDAVRDLPLVVELLVCSSFSRSSWP
jgi:hypothetical protein